MTRTASTLAWGVALVVAALTLGLTDSVPWTLGLAGLVPVGAGLWSLLPNAQNSEHAKESAAG